VRDTRGQDIDGACGQLAAADRVEGVPTVAVAVPGLERPRPEARPELGRVEEDGVLSPVALGSEEDA
jgi:hypothetical protein